MNVIKAKGLNKKFKKHSRQKGLWNAFKSLFKRDYRIIQAVKDVSLNIKKGEILGYLGPNGAGKSTVIKMLTGILHPDSGRAECLGYTPWLQRERYVQHIGAVFGQKSTLWWDLPPIDTFELNKNIYQVPEKEFNQRLTELTELLGVEDISSTPTRKLSFGERMRCEFINSLLHNPEIVFLDEPTVGVDVVAKERIRGFIKKINKEQGVTVLLTTHDVRDVEELCNRIIIIDKGEHIYEGSVKKLKKEYITHKELIVEFEDEPGRLRIPNCEVVSLEGVKAVLRADINKTSVGTIVQHLMDKHEVTDIDINEESVESIIRKIYQEGV